MGELKVNLTELQELIRSGENEKLEFKKSTGQRTDAARTVCAMLNGLGGFVFFGKTDKFLPNYSQCLLKMARFRGTDKSEFIDNRQEYGNAFDLFQSAQRFIPDHLPVAGRIIPSVFERIDDPLYPPAALREALANTLCHRDYSIGGGAISLAIYDDRLEISSTGDLPFGLTPEMLARPHASRPWNPLVAQTFYRRGIIEIWGRGTNKIIELTEQAGLPTPEFESYTGEFLIRFRPGKAALKTRQVGSGAESTGLKIIRLLSKKEYSKSEIANILGQNTITGFLNRMMNQLIKDCVIARTFPDKPASRLQKYRIAPAGLAELRRFQEQ